MYSVQVQVSDGTMDRINVSIEFFERDDITLYKGNEITPLILGTDWEWDTDTRINLLTDTPVPEGESITLRRNTDKDRAFNIYDGGAAFSRETLDENFRQMIYLAQEFTEGNGLTGLFFPLDMNGFQINNLGAGTEPDDAVNKGQLDVVDDRVSNLENSFITDTVSYPWRLILTETTDTVSPPYSFDKASVYLDGLCKVPGDHYIVVDDTIVFASAVPAGVEVFARLGEDTDSSTGYVPADEYAAFKADTSADLMSLDERLDTLEGTGATFDSVVLTGTPVAPTAPAGTNTTQLATMEAVQTAIQPLAPKANPTFTGTINADNLTLGSALPITSGGTGANTPAAARLSLGAAPTASPTFTGTATIPTLALTNPAPLPGVVDGSNAAAGKVGEYLSNTLTAVSMANITSVNLASITLTPGDWDVSGVVELSGSASNLTLVIASIGTTSVTLDGFPQRIRIPYAGVSQAAHAVPMQRFSVTANTVVYLVGQVAFASGTATGSGRISARRVR